MRRNGFKYILIRVFIGVLISLILWFLKTNVFALGNITLAPTGQTFYYLGGSGSTSKPITQFTREDSPNITWYGHNGNSNGTRYYQVKYDFNISSITEKNYYNIDFLFQNNWNGDLIDNYSFAIYHRGFYVCTSNASNSTDTLEQRRVKQVINVECDNVYIDSSSPTFYLIVQANDANSYGDQIGITRLNLIDNPYSQGANAITNAVNANTQAVEETNDTIKDSSVDNSKAESDINTMNSKVASNGTITQLLTLPISMYQAILNDINSSGCHTYPLGSLFGHYLSLPCVSTRLQNALGSTLYNSIDIILAGMLILALRKKFVDIFNNMTSLKDRGNEVE